MAKPDCYERSQYPLLAARETWPPEPDPSPDMTQPERDEHHRYWQDQRIDRMEELATMPSDKPWYEQTMERVQAGIGSESPAPVTERSQGYSRDEATATHERNLLDIAKSMPRTQAEIAVLDAVRDNPDETRRLVENFILQERMWALRERDRGEQLRRLPDHLREKLEALRQADRDHG